MDKKMIGVLGSGIVGQVLASGFLKHGYEVMIGTSDPRKLADWSAGPGKRGKIGSFEETAAYGEIIVLAVKGTVALSVLDKVNIANLDGKTVIDTTNPIADAPPDNGVLKFTTSLERSLMEELQDAFPQANFVKAFNSIGNAFMVNPQLDLKPTMFICGNSEDAKKEVSHILDLFGHEIADMGGVQGARAIEPLCMLWCIPGILRNEWMHAFKLLKP